MTLTVGFDATPAVRQAAGIGRYTRELLSALSRRDEFRFHLYAASRGEVHGALPPLSDRSRVRHVPLTDRVTNIVWHRLHLPLPVQMLTGAFDVFHSPDFTLPPTGRRPSILTVHDLAFLTVPDCAYPTLRAYLQEVVPRSAQRATHVIAVSEATRRDVVNLLRIPPERVTTVLEGAGERFRPLPRETAWSAVRKLGISDPYILAVGTLEPRKNYARLFEAYRRLVDRGAHQPLVLAGGPGWMFQADMQRLHDLGLGDRVRFVRPDDDTLVALYNAADLFVYASIYEGFGIPPLEALACGTPVACSNSSSLPEVVGDAAVLFDPLSVDDMAAAMERLLGSPDLQAQLRDRGMQRAAQFTWDRAAEGTAALYREVAGA